MPRKAQLLKSLSRGRVRPSMNKYNIFNLYKKRSAKQAISPLNSFRQQWYAKQETRGYHGEHIREGRWKTFFDPKLKGVAQLDASLSGSRELPTPLMMQTFAVLEKRLDFAVFRAMFASSVRQARQFILAADVKVNGVVIRDPNYTLRPGDIFSVAPDKVLQALGRKKPSLREAINVDNVQIAKWNKYVEQARENPYDFWVKRQDKLAKKKDVQTTQYDHDFLQNDEFSAEKVRAANERIFRAMLAQQKSTTRATVFRDIVAAAKGDVESVTADLFVAQFGPALAKKCAEVVQLLGKDNKILATQTADEFEQFLSTNSEEADKLKEDKTFNIRKVKQLINEVHSDYQNKLRTDAEQAQLNPNGATLQYSADWIKALRKHRPVPPAEEIEQSGEEAVSLHLPWQKRLFGRADPSKAYFTPWQPRPFLSTMAVLPHHIEISFETCHAIYLRDPVARPGASEVISPLPIDLHERAYMWYLRHS